MCIIEIIVHNVSTLALTSLICLYCCSFHSGLALRQFMKNCFTLMSRSSILSVETKLNRELLSEQEKHKVTWHCITIN